MPQCPRPIAGIVSGPDVLTSNERRCLNDRRHRQCRGADLFGKEWKMTSTIRRVVTGHDDKGRAVVVSDAAATQFLRHERRANVTLTNLWQCDGVPAEYDGPAETCAGPLRLLPPPDGCVFRIVEFQPEDPDELANIDGRSAFAAMGAGDHVVEGARHPFMHRTDSVDFAIVLEGEIDMLLDEDEVHLSAGDVVIQRGTNHAWSNRGEARCLIAFVLVDGVTRWNAQGAERKGIPVRTGMHLS